MNRKEILEKQLEILQSTQQMCKDKGCYETVVLIANTIIDITVMLEENSTTSS